ncbi:hypothetical protein Tsubulata_008625 [Turnera subulata]|uniref:DUF4283 domain-containing protein n=1 Tax=Turnera subulata TaxID=218843 RepID=A0A9Q0FR54_9ROSI|nr:hypothetical protein Tsubulata_008625 [Turnera subulata]
MEARGGQEEDKGSGRWRGMPDPTYVEAKVVVVEDKSEGVQDLSVSLCLVAKIWMERPFNSRDFMNTIKQRDKHRVLDNEPWNFDDQVVLLKELTGDEQSSLQFFHVLFWAGVYDVSFNQRSEKLVHALASQAGIFQGLEENCNLKRWVSGAYR